VVQRPALPNAHLQALPVGRLDEQTLLKIGLARLVHFRTGPWVALDEDGSRLLRVGEAGEPLLFQTLQGRTDALRPVAEPEEEAAERPPPQRPSRTVVFSGPSAGIGRKGRHATERARRGRNPRRH
jgi:hypothetical protein